MYLIMMAQLSTTLQQYAGYLSVVKNQSSIQVFMPSFKESICKLLPNLTVISPYL